MMTALQLHATDDAAVEIREAGGGLLLRYVVQPATEADESPRPFVHPLHTRAGELLTNFRPNDHRWHHGLSFTITRVGDVNFWGGPSYRRADGYRWRQDHGEQRHLGWTERRADRLAHTVEWRGGPERQVLLREERTLSPVLEAESSWSLRWQADLCNVSGRPLVLGNYHSAEGLAGSHYTGLQFRGARELLDDHGDSAIGIVAEGARAGEAAVHGVAAGWMEWRGQKDTSQRRVAVRFTNHGEPLRWFVRRANPLAAFPFQFDRDLVLVPGAVLRLDHSLTFTDL